MRPNPTSAVACVLLFVSLTGVASACTSFCMDTPEGPVFGCNLDLFLPGDGLVFVNRRGLDKEGYASSTTGQTAKWVSRYGSISLNIAGREFAWSGMNEAGLVVSAMELKAGEFPEADDRPPLSTGTWLQYMLDNCATVEDVIRMNADIRVQDVVPSHHLIADATGTCVAIEWIDGETVVHVGETLPLKAMANMPYERALKAFDRGGPRWWWSNPGQSAERVAGAVLRGRDYDPNRHGPAVSYAFDTLARVVAAPHTKWNVVYDIPAREIWYRSAASPTVKHIALNAQDFSCDAAPLMLDVNAPLEGDVGSSFVPYDREINLALFHQLVTGYCKIDVSPESARALMDLFESFDCSAEAP